MALPVTISGISTAVACVGPFKSSGGNYYFFGRDGTTATTLQAFKATDPSSSWSSVTSNTGFTTTINSISGYQQSDVIHLAVMDGSGTSVNLKYRTFDMSSDSFVTSETVKSAFNQQDSSNGNHFYTGIVFRGSDSQPIIAYNGTRVASMGNSYARIEYARRTGAAAWTIITSIDGGGAADFYEPDAALGSSDRFHGFWAGATAETRTLNSSNSLETRVSGIGGIYNVRRSMVSYDSSGTQKIVGVNGNGSFRFDSAAVPSVSNTDIETGAVATRIFNDGTTAYAVYRFTDGDLYVETSTDHGATWGTKTNIFTATVASNEENLSIDGNIYQRGSSFVIPYIVNDNGTLKYNEHTVRTSSASITVDAGSYTLIGQNVTLFRNLPLTVDAGSYALTGQAVTLTHQWCVPVDPGSYALTGQDVSLLHQWRVTIDAGSYALTGQDVTLNKGLTLAIDAGSYSLTGQDVTLTHQWRVAVDAGSYALTGQDVTLRRNLPLIVDAGSYALTGQDVSLYHGWRVSVDAGSYSLTGQDVTLTHQWRVSVDAGSYSLTGQDVTLFRNLPLTVDAGSYALTGQDVTLTHQWRVTIDPSSYALTGQDVELTKSASTLLITVDAGSYALTGQDVTLLHAWVVTVDAGSYALTGQDVTLTHQWRVAIDSGSYALTGQDVTLTHQWVTAIDAGSYLLTGQDVTLAKSGAFSIEIEAGGYLLSGQDVTLTLSGVPPDVIPPPDNGGVGSIRSIATRKGSQWRSIRLFRKKPEEITAREIREVAQEIREEVREGSDFDLSALRSAADRLQDIKRLEKAVAEFTAALEFARVEQARQQDEDDSEVLLLF